MTAELWRAYKLAVLWLFFGLYGTFFPACAMVAGTLIQGGVSEWKMVVQAAIDVLAPLPFLQSLGFGFFASAVHDLMSTRHYPGNAPASAAIVMFSVLVLSIGYYAALATSPAMGGLGPGVLVKLQLTLTMAAVGLATLLKFSQVSAPSSP